MYMVGCAKKTFRPTGLILSKNYNEKNILYRPNVSCHVMRHVTCAISSYMWHYSVQYVVTSLVSLLHQ